MNREDYAWALGAMHRCAARGCAPCAVELEGMSSQKARDVASGDAPSLPAREGHEPFVERGPGPARSFDPCAVELGGFAHCDADFGGQG